MDSSPVILVCGKNKICADGLKMMAQCLSEYNIVYVYAEKDRDAAQIAIDAAERLQIYTRCVQNARDFTNVYLSLKPAILFSIQFSILLSPLVVEHGRDRLLNLHFSLLPRYRGMAPITLAILNGDPAFGVTLHVIDAGIDTGAIIDQQSFQIQGMTNREVYTQCEQAGLELIKRNMHLFRMAHRESGLAFTSTPQDDGEAIYFSKADVDYTLTRIDFNRTAVQIERQARAYLFPPSLYPSIEIDGKVLRVKAPPVIGERCTHCVPGTMLERNPLTLASRDRALIFGDTEGVG